MQDYEAMLVMAPYLEQEHLKETAKTYAGIVEDSGGTIATWKSLGRRRLAYPIAGHNEGIYVLMLFTAGPPALDELKRELMLSESVIRHLIVRREEAAPAPEELEKAEEETAAEEVTVEVAEEAPAEVAEEAPAEIADEVAAEVAEEAPAEVAEEVSTEAAPEVAEEAPAEVADEVAAEVAQEAPTEVAEEVSTEAAPVATEGVPDEPQEPEAPEEPVQARKGPGEDEGSIEEDVRQQTETESEPSSPPEEGPRREEE